MHERSQPVLVYGLLFLDPARTTLLWTVALFAQWAAGAIAFRLEGEPKRDLLLLLLQQLVYRQLMYRDVRPGAAGLRAGADAGRTRDRRGRPAPRAPTDPRPLYTPSGGCRVPS